jgi:LPS sulfotransferase NodH
MSSFIVLSTQRSGSTWCIDCLRSHGNIIAFGELFAPAGALHGRESASYRVPLWQEVAGPPKGALRSRGLFSYLDAVFELAPQAGKSVGFKLMYNQLRENPALLWYLRSRRIRVVHLLRRNLLDVVVSRKVAEATQVFQTAVPVECPAIRLEPFELSRDLNLLIQRQRWMRRLLRWSGLAHQEFAYEALVEDDRAFSRMAEFLGEEARRGMSSNLVKIVDRHPASLIVNYVEIKAALRGGPHASLLAEWELRLSP